MSGRPQESPVSRQLPAAVNFVPYSEIADNPHIVVDGAPLPKTEFTLSHWPNNKTPEPLRRDTSTATAFAYLDHPEYHQTIPSVTNNHFDEDGLFSMFVLCHPDIAIEHQSLLESAALAGDFGIHTDPQGLRLCFAIEAIADPVTSFLPTRVFDGCERLRTAALYREMLDRLPELMSNLDTYSALWAPQMDHFNESCRLIDDGRVVMEEQPEHDLVIVRVPEDILQRDVRRYISLERAAVHPFAINSRTTANRVLTISGRSFDFHYRYESFVQFVSRRPHLRVSLEPLAEELNRYETASGRWIGEPVNEVIPRLYLDGSPWSSISEPDFLSMLTSHFLSAPVAWDPYDWNGDRR